MAGKAPDLKLQILVQDEVEAALRRAEARIASSEGKRKSNDEKAARERIGLQRRSIDVENRQAKQQQDALLRLQLDVDRARASALTNLHARQRAMAQAQYNWDKEKFKNNKDALLLIEEKHATRLAALARREAEYATTPFQQLLGQLGRLTSLVPGAAPVVDAVAAARARGVPPDPRAGIVNLAGAGSSRAVGAEVAGGAASAAGAAASSGLGSALLTGGAVAAGMAAVEVFKRLAAVIPQAVHEYESQIRADRLLESAMRATGSAAGGSLSAMKDYASELQRVTRFSDDEVEGAQAVALQFDRIGRDTFPRAVRAAADLAAATGGDLRGAMETVGRAIQQPESASRMLRSANILLSDSQKKVIDDLERTGKTSEATAYILGLFEQKVGGAAEATALESEKLKNRWGDVFENMGRVVEPVINAVNRLAVAVAEAFTGGAGTDQDFLDRARRAYEDTEGYLAEVKAQNERANRERLTDQAKANEDFWAQQQEFNRKMAAGGGLAAILDAARQGRAATAADMPKVPAALDDDQVKRVKDINARARRAELDAISVREDDLEAARDKSLRIADFEYRQRLEKEGGFAEADKALTREHTAEKTRIWGDYYKAHEKQQDAAQREIEDRQFAAFDRQLSDAREREARELKEQQAAEARLRQSERDPVGRLDLGAREQELKAQQTLELMALKDNLDARATLEKAHANEMRSLHKQTRREQAMEIASMTVGLLGAIDSIYSRSKKNAELHKRLAEAQIVISTSEAVMKTWAAWGGWPAGVIPAGIMAATGAAQLAAVENQGFRSGGYTGSGYPGDPAGIVHKDEYVVDSPDVRRLGGPGGVAAALSGGRGGDTYHFHIAPPSDWTEEKATRMGYAVTDGARASVRNQKLRERMNDREKIQT